MTGNGDGGIDIGVVEAGRGHVLFRAGIGPSTDIGRVPGLLSETLFGDLEIDRFEMGRVPRTHGTMYRGAATK